MDRMVRETYDSIDTVKPDLVLSAAIRGSARQPYWKTLGED